MGKVIVGLDIGTTKIATVCDYSVRNVIDARRFDRVEQSIILTTPSCYLCDVTD